MENASLLLRLSNIESRLQQLERFMHTTVGVESVKPPLVDREESPTLEGAPVQAAATRATVHTPPPLLRGPVQIKPPFVAPVALTTKTRGSPANLEQEIGLKWAGWVGAIVLVIGAGFGIKFGYEQGWFSIATPAVRLGVLTLIGFALIAAGEWVYRKINKLSAVGLFGSGIALLFLISYAGQAYYHLYDRDTAFIFIGLATLIGTLVARRGRLVSIAVLSMIGGNLAPLLIQQNHPELFGILSYLLLLQIMSLALAAWGANVKWWVLRGLSLATTSLWVWAVIDGQPQLILLVFTILFAFLYQAELLFSAHRSRFNSVNTGATFSLLVTTALTVAILYLQRDAVDTIRFVEILVLAGSAALLAGVSLRLKADRLMTGFVIQSIALVLVSVPMILSGIWIAFTWGILSIAFAIAARLLKLQTSRYAAFAAWVLALADLILWARGFYGTMHQYRIAFWILNSPIPDYAAMGGLLALMGHCNAQLISADIAEVQRSPSLRDSLSVVSTLVWIIVSLSALPPLGATGSLLLFSMLLLVSHRLIGGQDLLLQSAIVCVLAALKWQVVDMLLPRLNSSEILQSALLSLRNLTGLFVLAGLSVHYFFSAPPEWLGRRQKQAFGGLVVCVLLCIGSFIVDQAFINQRLTGSTTFTDPGRAEQVALSIFWSIFALTSVITGFIWQITLLRYFGLALFAMILLKVVTIDLNQVSTGYRILSFIGLGGVLIGTSVVYGKVSPVLLSEKRAKERSL